MRYKVVVHQTEEGVSVWCPGLPGCWSQGDTEQAALENIADAIKEYLGSIEAAHPKEHVREVDVA